MMVRPVNVKDSDAIADVYNYYVATSHSTFEIEPVSTSEMRKRIGESIADGYPFLLCEASDGTVVGYAYAHQYRPRAAYLGTVEVSVYVRDGIAGQGIGSKLYDVLLPAIFHRGAHTLLAGIALPNDASVALHEKYGFKKVAHFSEVGRKFDTWIDVGYWQLLGRMTEADQTS